MMISARGRRSALSSLYSLSVYRWANEGNWHDFGWASHIPGLLVWNRMIDFENAFRCSLMYVICANTTLELLLVISVAWASENLSCPRHKNWKAKSERSSSETTVQCMLVVRPKYYMTCELKYRHTTGHSLHNDSKRTSTITLPASLFTNPRVKRGENGAKPKNLSSIGSDLVIFFIRDRCCGRYVFAVHTCDESLLGRWYDLPLLHYVPIIRFPIVSLYPCNNCCFTYAYGVSWTSSIKHRWKRFHEKGLLCSFSAPL